MGKKQAPFLVEEQEPEATAQKKANKPVLFLVLLCALLFAGCIAAFYLGNGAKYQEAMALAEQGDFNGAKKLSGVLLPVHEDLPQLRAYINAGLLQGEGHLEEAGAAFFKLGDFLHARDFAADYNNDAKFREAQILFTEEKYEEALAMFTELGGFGESPLWAEECAYRIGIGYYERLRDAMELEEILSLSAKALESFGGMPGHENATIMQERTSTYVYALGRDTFEAASSLFNQIDINPTGSGAQSAEGETEEAPEDDEDSAALEEDTAPGTDAGANVMDAIAQSAMPMFEDALQFFSLVPEFADSAQYMQLIGMLNNADEKALALSLRETMWEFAPARKFILGRYISHFFLGSWSGGGYGITFTDIYHFYMLTPEDGTGASFGSGGISNNTKTGWKTAYSFRVLGKDAIDVIGSQTYTLSREQEGTVTPEGETPGASPGTIAITPETEGA